jgi:hypothetical protein
MTQVSIGVAFDEQEDDAEVAVVVLFPYVLNFP